jgi:hypothetical protein
LAIVVAVGLDLDDVTIYALRHSSIVRQLLASVPVRVVAVNPRHFGSHDRAHLQPVYWDHADALAKAKALLDIAAVPDDNIVRITAAR